MRRLAFRFASRWMVKMVVCIPRSRLAHFASLPHACHCLWLSQTSAVMDHNVMLEVKSKFWRASNHDGILRSTEKDIFRSFIVDTTSIHSSKVRPARGHVVNKHIEVAETHTARHRLTPNSIADLHPRGGLRGAGSCRSARISASLAFVSHLAFRRAVTFIKLCHHQSFGSGCHSFITRRGPGTRSARWERLQPMRRGKLHANVRGCGWKVGVQSQSPAFDYFTAGQTP